ncbi:MAG: hypothetical protein ACNA77_10465 [Opitutales bacterium]
MKRILLTSTLILSAAATALPGATLPENLNRISFGPRVGFNIKAEFSNNPTAFTPGALTAPGDAIGGINHEYDDGYVRVDSSGNAGGTTWNWGYVDNTQVVGDTMEFHASQANAAHGPSNSTAEDDPQYGVELIYQRLVAPLGHSGLWGWEAAFSFTDLDIDHSSRGTGANTVITDSYALNGVVPPMAPHNGTFAGPGALLGDTPTRTITSDTMTSRESLTGEIFAFRFGPFAEWDVGERLSVSLGAGLTLAPTMLDYKFSETTENALGGTTNNSGSSSKTRLLYGGYINTMLRYDIDGSWGFFAGAQFQNMSSMKLSSGTREARLDQSATLYGTAGLSFQF